MNQQYYQNYQFDFEVGYLVKSPCKTCDQRDSFPKCLVDCHLIDAIHSLMTHSISCSSRYSSIESSALAQQGWERK